MLVGYYTKAFFYHVGHCRIVFEETNIPALEHSTVQNLMPGYHFYIDFYSITQVDKLASKPNLTLLYMHKHRQNRSKTGPRIYKTAKISFFLVHILWPTERRYVAKRRSRRRK